MTTDVQGRVREVQLNETLTKPRQLVREAQKSFLQIPPKFLAGGVGLM
jgi:hypothetical protein